MHYVAHEVTGECKLFINYTSAEAFKNSEDGWQGPFTLDCCLEEF